MKKIYYLLFLIFFLPSCSKDFLETRPTDGVSEVILSESVENNLKMLNGIHRLMYAVSGKENGTVGGQFILGISEAMGEDYVLGNNQTYYQIRFSRFIGSRDKTNSLNGFAYQFLYQVISNANMILDYIDEVPGNDELRKMVKGEALAYRGWAYSILVQFYGKRYVEANAATDLAVPLMLTSSLDPQPRATVAKVYERINEDLKQADELLTSSTYAIPDKTHLSAFVVKGLRARVALTMGNYGDAKKFANEARTLFVSKGGKLMTAAEFKGGFFDAKNPEWMWASIVSETQANAPGSFCVFWSWNLNYTTTRANPKGMDMRLYAKMDAVNDVRAQLVYPTGIPKADFPTTTYTTMNYATKKFAAKNPANSGGDVLYMRLAEMYLIEAEAKARLGEADATDLLFELVKTRNSAYTKSTKTGNELVEEVLLQRRFELWGEGFRWFDLKRLNLNMDKNGSNHVEKVIQANGRFVAAGATEWQFVFSEGEENANPYIKETPNP